MPNCGPSFVGEGILFDMIRIPLRLLPKKSKLYHVVWAKTAAVAILQLQKDIGSKSNL